MPVEALSRRKRRLKAGANVITPAAGQGARSPLRGGPVCNKSAEAALREVERRCVPAPLLWRHRLEKLPPAGGATISEAAAKWLREVEANYLAEY